MALAIPRIAPPDGAAVGLPRPLPPSEAIRIRRIFALQARGDIPEALRETARLDTGGVLGTAMLGHILAERYLGAYFRPSAEQLRDWLDRWPDLPDARSIHNLLVVRMPRGEAVPPLPAGAIRVVDDHADTPVPEETEPEATALKRDPGLDQKVWAAARLHGAGAVERLLARRGLPSAYAAQLRGEAAQILFTLNRDREAQDLAASGVHGCGPGRSDACARAALPGYVAGLAAWRLDRFDAARAMFQAAWRAEVTTPTLRAGAAFWAARGFLREGDIAGAMPWLIRAAEQRRTFYGMLARRTLGMPLGPQRLQLGERETLGEADIDAIGATPRGLRAFALLQVEQPERAEAELRGLWPAARDSRALARAVMLVADQAGMSDLAVQYADLLAAADGRPRERMRFPLPKLRPAGGFIVDPSLVYGLARAESNFNADLVSSAGARGILQIMPDTAGFMVGARNPNRLRSQLDDPAFNLDLGQQYLAYLAKQDMVDGDLIRLLAAYNTGPGSFAHWAPLVRDKGDPLLFIEAIPIDETRAHVPRVLTYSWMYAARLRLPANSLDELAAGQWPRYIPFDAPRAFGMHMASSLLH